MKAFQVVYSEGDPTIVIADGFDEALSIFVAHILREIGDDGDHDTTPTQVRDWVENVNLIGSEVVTTVSTIKGVLLHGEDHDTVLL